jgi:hypothetical protein
VSQEEFAFQRDGFFGRCGDSPLNPVDQVHQSPCAPGVAVRVNVAVAVQAIAQVARLADVEKFAGGIVHEIHAGSARNAEEEFATEALAQGFGAWE